MTERDVAYAGNLVVLHDLSAGLQKGSVLVAPLLHHCDTLSEGREDFLCGFFLSALALIVCVYLERHLHTRVASEVLDFFDVQSAFKQACDIGMAKLMSCNREVERTHDSGVSDSGAV